MLRRFLARQFARPSGFVGRYWIGPWLDRIAGEMNALALEVADVRAGERVIEIGFGGGALLRALTRRGARAVGADLSPAMVARARARGLEVVEASVEALPFAAASFDKVISINSLYFWPDIESALGELARILRPGGILVLAFEPPQELRKWPGHRHGFRLYEVADVAAALRGTFANIRTIWGRGRKPDLFCCLSATRIGANG